jgi:hypothetical protein
MRADRVTQDKVMRRCACCGVPTATRSIPACWEHWNVLPEDLRSSIVKSHGRGQIKQYKDTLLEAVMLWRQTGVWRNWRRETPLPVINSSTPITSNPRVERKLIYLPERRGTFVVATTVSSDPDFELWKWKASVLVNEAELRLREGERRIRSQREIVTRLKQAGVNAEQARKPLSLLLTRNKLALRVSVSGTSRRG